MVASLGKAQEFRNGRQLSAWLGMVPRQYSSVDTRKRPHPNNCGYAHWRDGYRIAPKLRFNAR
jgi:transposase